LKIYTSSAATIYLIGSGGMGLSHPCDSHVYVIESAGESAMIDAGSGVKPERLYERMLEDGIDPLTIKTIILTHSHWDHSRGAAWAKRLTGARLAVHQLGVKTMQDIRWPTSHLEKHGIQSEAAHVECPLQDNDVIQLGRISLKVIHTPGHSDDSICLLTDIDGKSILFGGDTCFAEGGHGTVNAETNFRAYRDSVKRLDAIKIDVLLPGHKHFVLSRAFSHISLLERKLSGSWTDVVQTRVPFFPTWWLEHDSSLYDDAQPEVRS